VRGSPQLFQTTLSTVEPIQTEILSFLMHGVLSMCTEQLTIPMSVVDYPYQRKQPFNRY